MKKANWLKIASFIGMGLGFIGTIISEFFGSPDFIISVSLS